VAYNFTVLENINIYVFKIIRDDLFVTVYNNLDLKPTVLGP